MSRDELNQLQRAIAAQNQAQDDFEEHLSELGLLVFCGLIFVLVVILGRMGWL